MIIRIATDENFEGAIIRGILMGKNVCGIFVVNTNASLGLIIDQLCMIIDASDIREWDNLVTFLPFV